MIGNKINFIVSAAIFASTVYFLWIKIKRNTKFFKRDDLDDKCLENKGKDINVQSENETNIDKSKPLLENTDFKGNINQNSTDIKFTNQKAKICQQANFEDNIQVNFDSVDDFSDVDISVRHNLSYSLITTSSLDKEVEDMLCNDLQNIDINSSTTQDLLITDKLENCLYKETLEMENNDEKNVNIVKLYDSKENTKEITILEETNSAYMNKDKSDETNVEMSTNESEETMGNKYGNIEEDITEEKEDVNTEEKKMEELNTIADINKYRNGETTNTEEQGNTDEKVEMEEFMINEFDNVGEDDREGQHESYDTGNDMDSEAPIIEMSTYEPEEGEILEESFLDKQYDDTVHINMSDREEIYESFFEKQDDDVEDDKERASVDNMQEHRIDEIFNTGISINELEEGEILGESFVGNQYVEAADDKIKEQVDIKYNMNDRVEMNDGLFLEKQEIDSEEVKQCGINETLLMKVSTRVLEEGEILEESFIDNQDSNTKEDKEGQVDIEKNMNDLEELNEQSFIEKQDVDVEVDGEIYVMDKASNLELPTKELEGEILEESFVEKQEVITEGHKEQPIIPDINGNMNNETSNLDISKNQWKEKINKESFLEKYESVIEKDGGQHVIDESSNIEISTKDFEEIIEESFIKKNHDKIENMSDKTDNAEISENLEELPIVEELLIEKQDINVKAIPLVDNNKVDIVDCNGEAKEANYEEIVYINGTSEAEVVERSVAIQNFSIIENVEVGRGDNRSVPDGSHCDLGATLEMDINNEQLDDNSIEEEVIVKDVQEAVISNTLDRSNSSLDQLDETETNASDSTAINEQNQCIPVKESDDVDKISDISQTSDYRNDSSLDSLLGGGSLMEYIEDCLSSKKSDDSGDIEGTNKLENWPNDEDCLNNIKRDFYDISNNICSPHPSSESDHAHCVNNLTERVAILSAESILDSHGQVNSSDSERTPTLSSPSFDDCNPELYVEKITYGDKELDVVYFEESVLEEGGVQTDIKIVRTIPVGLGGRIIGKKGKTKNELMKKFGAQLLIYNHPDEIGKQVLQITCNPSVSDQLERWVNKTLEQITKNTIQTTVSHPEWLKPMIPLGRLVAAHVVDMSTIQHVKLRIYDADLIKAYSEMQREMNADYASGDSTSLLPRPVAIGCVCVAMIRPDYFLRAQIIEIYEDIASVYLFDIGKVCQTYLFYLFKIREKYMRVPFQVIPARLPHALLKNQNISPAVIHKRFLCDQKTMKPKMVRVFFPRMNTCCEPCVNIYIPMSSMSDGSSGGLSGDDSEEFVDLLELLVSMDVCSMVRETINSDIQVKINSNHFKAFLNEKQRKQVANVTVPMYFQPCNNKFYEDYVEFKLLENNDDTAA